MECEKAFNIAVGCVLGSDLDMSEKMQVIEVLRNAELKMGDAVTRSLKSKRWVLPLYNRKNKRLSLPL